MGGCTSASNVQSPQLQHRKGGPVGAPRKATALEILPQAKGTSAALPECKSARQSRIQPSSFTVPSAQQAWGPQRETVDEDEVEDFFDEAMLDVNNRQCVDSGAAEPAWADVHHGVYVSIEAAGVHRSLGRDVCCVRSLEMDSWSAAHLRLMKAGGNRRFAEALREHGVPDSMPARQKYGTRAAAWYRQYLRAVVEGVDPPAPPSAGTGALPVAAFKDGAAAESEGVLSRTFKP